MTGSVFAAVALTGFLSVSAIALEEDALPKFKEHCQSIVDAKSYRFEIVTKEKVSRGGGGRKRAGNNRPKPEAKISGTFKKGEPLHLKGKEHEVYRRKAQMVYRPKNGSWQLFDPRKLREEDGSERGEGGLRKRKSGEERGSGRKGRGREARNPLFQALGPFRNLLTVDGVLSDVGGKIRGVTVADTNGKTVYTATLTERAAKALSKANRNPSGGRKKRGGGGEGGEEERPRGRGERRNRAGSETSSTGSLRVTVSANGTVQIIELETHSNQSVRDRKIERKRTTTIRILDVNQADLVVPAGVLSKFKTAADRQGSRK